MLIYRKNTIRLSGIVVLLLGNFIAFVSDAQITRPVIHIESDLLVSAGKNPPYFLVSNQQGIFSVERNAFLLRLGMTADFDTSRHISLSYGLDAIYRYDSNHEIWLQQAYVRTKIYFLILQGGFIEESFGNQDDQLSSGPYLYSRNARPIPKIALSTDDYIVFPFTGNLIEINGYFAHGWLGETDQYVKDAYLHQKFFYIRIGEKRFRWSVNFGIHHTVMWGGVSPEYGQLPENCQAYKSVVFGKMKEEMGPVNEQQNAIGNHLASYSLGMDYSLKRYKLRFYWQTMLEDKNGRVGIDWKNKSDGLWGLTIQSLTPRPAFRKLVLEFFNSTNQSGDPSKSGGDNYFNNYLYRSGWTYHKMTIGTPLITSPVFTDRTPEMTDYLDNNRIRAISAGMLFQANAKQLYFKFIYSRNYGTVALPYSSPQDQIYSTAEYTYFSKRYRDLSFSWQAALDLGSHLGNNAGLLLKIRKTF
jgi:hypothetical protein